VNPKSFGYPAQTLSLLYLRIANLTGYWAPRTLPNYCVPSRTPLPCPSLPLPSTSIPKLDATGLNWAVFSLRFEDSVQGKGFWGHFSGTTPCPTATIESAPTADELAAIENWEKDESSARSLLTQKLPDSALMCIRNKPSVKERWEAITTEFTQKGAFAQMELCARFLDMKCPEKGNASSWIPYA
jgi:hypothetical protein